MKRFWIGLFFIFGMICCINSSELMDFYYHDYDLITRAVMVFDEKPEYKIEQEDDKIITYIFDAKLKASLPDSLIHHSPVFTQITSESNGDVLQVNFHTHEQMLFINFGFSHKGYKLVYDIYSIDKPTTVCQHRSFADFYTIVGFQDKAQRHLQIAESLEKTEKVSITEEATKSNDWLVRFIQTKVEFRNYLIPLWILLTICLGLLIVLTMLLLLLNKAKKRSKRNPQSKIASIQTGFGSDEFQKKLAHKLSKHQWDISSIAQELHLSEEKVKEYLSDTGE